MKSQTAEPVAFSRAAEIPDLSRLSALPRLRELIAALFIVSGAAGLIYQIVWTRDLVLLFGNTSQAVSTTVAAFLAGLGLGGFLGGKISLRVRRPLVAYALAEAATGLAAFFVPGWISAILGLYGSAYLTWSPTELGLLRFGLCFLVIGPVTTVMGATLPFLASFSIRRVEQAGIDLSQLYTANTLGAIVGTLLSAFALIELLGLRGTSLVAVSANLAAAAGAVLIDARVAAGHRALPDPPGPARWPRGDSLLVLVYSFASGFIALGLEVLWTRLFSEGTGGPIYIFAAILALYLLGIAAGSRLYFRLPTSSLGAVGVCAAVIAFAAAATAIVASRAVVAIPLQAQMLMLAPATLAMGYAFPLVAGLLTTHPRLAGAQVGRMYAVNTLGAILGAFSGVFVLAPTIGTPVSVYALGALSGAFALLLLWRGAPSRRIWRSSTTYIACTAIALNLTVATTGTALSRTSTQNKIAAGAGSARHYEDVASTVDAQGPAGNGELYSAGMALTRQTVVTKLIAYYPLALRPASKTMLVVGLGMGSTYRSALILGLKTDVVELSPSVPRAMDVFYPDATSYLHNPNGRVYISDGRNYVKLTDKRYDLVVADPPPPVNTAGVVLLYSEEFMQEVKAKLAPNGVFVLWFPYGGLWSDFQSHLRTFRAEWPHEMLVSGGGWGVFMIGSRSPLSFTEASLRSLFGRATTDADMADSLERLHWDAATWSKFAQSAVLATDGQFDVIAGGAPVITDDRPVTEYWMLGWLFGDRRAAEPDLLRSEIRRLGITPSARP